MTPITRAHPEQLSLPGQAHVAPGPHDQTGMYVMHQRSAATSDTS